MNDPRSQAGLQSPSSDETSVADDGDREAQFKRTASERGVATGEGRQHFRPRHKIVWPVEIALASTPAAPVVRAYTHGLSLGGAYIAENPQFGVGTRLVLRFQLPDPRPAGAPETLLVQAEVRWQNPHAREDLPLGFGVAFLALTPEQEIILHGYFSRPHGVR